MLPIRAPLRGCRGTAACAATGFSCAAAAASRRQAEWPCEKDCILSPRAVAQADMLTARILLYGVPDQGSRYVELVGIIPVNSVPAGDVESCGLIQDLGGLLLGLATHE